MDISTTYMGLILESPVIIGSSGLTDSVEKLKQIGYSHLPEMDGNYVPKSSM